MYIIINKINVQYFINFSPKGFYSHTLVLLLHTWLLELQARRPGQWAHDRTVWILARQEVHSEAVLFLLKKKLKL